MASRDYTIVYTTMTEEECKKIMVYPYSYINDEFETRYDLKNILRDIYIEKKEDRAEVGDFPKNIRRHFWVSCGERDERPWISCGQLDNDAYFFYTGSCDYTGFDCQGGMRLWVSTSWKNIIDHAMSQGEYEQYKTLYDPLNDTHQEEEHEEEEEEEEEEEQEDRGICVHCKEAPATMANEFTDDDGYLCADCFWDLDSELKRKRRSDPEWRYFRVYSTCKELMNLSETEAKEKARESVMQMEGGSWWLAKNILPC